MKSENLSILIVEDEPNFADTLEMFVEKLGYQVTGIEDHADQAMLLFQQNAPDLVLMDIHIKGEITGITLAEKMQKLRTVPIIFITSYDDPETFEAAKATVPFAYLIKPFDPDQLERSMALAIQKMHGENDHEAFAKGHTSVQGTGVFFLKERNKLIKVNEDEILWVTVDDKYSLIHTANREFILRQSLSEVAERLNANLFVRIHRSWIVNLKAIEDIDLSSYTVNINQQELPLGQSYKDHLLSLLDTLK